MKKLFTVLLGLVLVGSVSSCDKMNQAVKAAEMAQLEVKKCELELEILEEKKALLEEMLELDDKMFIEIYEKKMILGI